MIFSISSYQSYLEAPIDSKVDVYCFCLHRIPSLLENNNTAVIAESPLFAYSDHVVLVGKTPSPESRLGT